TSLSRSGATGTRRIRFDLVFEISTKQCSSPVPVARTRFTSAPWARHNSPHLSPVPSANRHTNPGGSGSEASFAASSPRLNGKVERSHKTDAMEFNQLLSYKDDVDLGAKLEEWERFYNLVRPHGAHQGKTPYEVLRERLSSGSDCQAPA